jgi:predicted Zn-dependent protease
MNRILRLSILCLLILAFAGCSDVALTGRKQLHLVPASTVQSMALTNYKQFLSENKVSADAAMTARVRTVGQRIQKAVESYMASQNKSDSLAGYQWEFNLVENKEVNAWCMPGGKVVVYTGLLTVATTEPDLAVVMGHEIAHAVADHGGERLSQQLVVNLGGMGLDYAIKNKPEAAKQLFTQAYSTGSSVGVLLPYSRLHENEADHLGLIFMAMAGYDPNNAVAFWKKMSAASTGSKPMEILSTHPADATRIKNIQAELPEAQKYYKPSK